ncbi:hypothetical protein B0H14DRAFT_2634327 [Mycena olivaceomarginata]|nr:hypothetical protein B0H14DRAFT_2634327 [Mycena olivaceomarginata]
MRFSASLWCSLPLRLQRWDVYGPHRVAPIALVSGSHSAPASCSMAGPHAQLTPSSHASSRMSGSALTISDVPPRRVAAVQEPGASSVVGGIAPTAFAGALDRFTAGTHQRQYALSSLAAMRVPRARVQWPTPIAPPARLVLVLRRPASRPAHTSHSTRDCLLRVDHGHHA